MFGLRKTFFFLLFRPTKKPTFPPFFFPFQKVVPFPVSFSFSVLKKANLQKGGRRRFFVHVRVRTGSAVCPTAVIGASSKHGQRRSACALAMESAKALPSSDTFLNQHTQAFLLQGSRVLSNDPFLALRPPILWSSDWNHCRYFLLPGLAKSSRPRYRLGLSCQG